MLRVSELQHQQIDHAFPLMESVLPGLTLEQWRRYASDISATAEDRSPSTGIMIAAAANGVLRAAFIYRIERRSGDGYALVVRHMAVRHLAIPPLVQQPAANALADAIERIARERGCDTVTIELPPNANWEIAFFRKRGFEVSVSEEAHRLFPEHG